MNISIFNILSSRILFNSVISTSISYNEFRMTWGIMNVESGHGLRDIIYLN